MEWEAPREHQHPGGPAGARAQGLLPSRRQGHGQAPRGRSRQRLSGWGQCQISSHHGTRPGSKGKRGRVYPAGARLPVRRPSQPPYLRSGWDGMPAAEGTGVHADSVAEGAWSMQFPSAPLTPNTIKIQLTGECWIRGQRSKMQPSPLALALAPNSQNKSVRPMT